MQINWFDRIMTELFSWLGFSIFLWALQALLYLSLCLFFPNLLKNVDFANPPGLLERVYFSDILMWVSFEIIYSYKLSHTQWQYLLQIYISFFQNRLGFRGNAYLLLPFNGKRIGWKFPKGDDSVGMFHFADSLL